MSPVSYKARRLRTAGLVLATGFVRTARAQAPLDAPAAQEVLVSGIRPARDASEVKLGAAQARREPGTQGDPVKVIESLPGVARASFGSGQLVLWGAAPEDTRVFVDGVPIPQLFHGSGISSTVSGDLLQSVSLTPGAYGVDYGRGIGGLVRLETRELPRDGSHLMMDVNTLDGAALGSAALSERVRVAVAVRYGWLDRVLTAVSAADVSEFFAVPRYRDYQAKLQVALRDREALELVLLGSGDDLTRVVPHSDPNRARSVVTSSSFQRVYLRYRRMFDDGASVEVLPWFGWDSSRSDAHFGENPALLAQRALRFGLRAEHRSRLAPSVSLRLGLDFEGTRADLSRAGSLLIPAREGDVRVFGQPPGDDTNSDHWRASALGLAPYATLDWELGPLTVSPGLRIDTYLLETSRKTPRVGQTPSIGQSALAAEFAPRLAARVRLSSRVALFGSAGLYSQPPAPADLSAVFGTPTLGPESASHLTLGESVELNSTLAVQVTGFYRSLSDLTVREPTPTPRLAQSLVSSGVGHSYGVQLLVRQRPWHGFFGWLAYTISRSERQETSAANPRLFDYDQPHVVALVASKEHGNWTFGVRFRYASGAPRTPVIAALFDEKHDRYQPVFGSQNSDRLPDFWQLDVRVDRNFWLGRWGRLLAYVELLNLTNHENGEEYAYSSDYTQRGVITGLPFLGVAGVRLEL
ncbi:MAG TPA: TonB-dependent receptor plug domain-containing protein [Polyangiaceae bacterium]